MSSRLTQKVVVVPLEMSSPTIHKIPLNNNMNIENMFLYFSKVNIYLKHFKVLLLSTLGIWKI